MGTISGERQTGLPLQHRKQLSLHDCIASGAGARQAHDALRFQIWRRRHGQGATGTLSADGRQIAEGKIERTVPIRYALDEGLNLGEDTGTPVNLSYDVPFKF